eukprot:SAG11_NODE_1548_length_4703_cov_6.701564_1_plen_108_part_00
MWWQLHLLFCPRYQRHRLLRVELLEGRLQPAIRRLLLGTERSSDEAGEQSRLAWSGSMLLLSSPAARAVPVSARAMPREQSWHTDQPGGAQDDGASGGGRRLNAHIS